MTVGEFVDDTFSIATGWLGWTPDVALNTPIPQIVLAYKGMIKKSVETSPFKAPKKPTGGKSVIDKAKRFASRFSSDDN